MFGNAPSAAKRYGVALSALAAATLLRLWADPLLAGSGFAIMFAAVMIAAWYGGLGPSLLALTLSLAISIALFGPPRDEPPEPPIRVWTGLAVFFF
ncbi:MAG TPA: DUF4118 domain-containing protein, partial [Pirellulales bacterium]|nr:DUF4118 domain-containing protein [Pirellulales bacterium]